MEFFILIVVNIFLGTLFYLVITLKLEKSASTFREKKLRREMDDIIKEFNETAERNILLLERKISVVRRLLQEAGTMKSVDVNIGNEAEGDIAAGAGVAPDLAYREKDGPVPDPGEKPEAKTFLAGKGKKDIPEVRDIVSNLKKGFVDLAEGVLRRLAKRPSGAAGEGAEPVPRHEGAHVESGGHGPYAGDAMISAPGGRKDFSIEKEYRDIQEKLASDSLTGTKKELPLSPDEIRDLFSSAEDKYSLISMLYGKGYSVEILSRFSGIPANEVKLVLDLSNSL
jgi:hypothetical protein